MNIKDKYHVYGERKTHWRTKRCYSNIFEIRVEMYYLLTYLLMGLSAS
jgi:hypothetical protein